MSSNETASPPNTKPQESNITMRCKPKPITPAAERCERELFTGTGSQPDLSKLNDVADLNIMRRKRKQPGTDCNCRIELLQLHQEMKDMFEAFTLSQKEYLHSLHEDISHIKSKVDNIQATTEHLASEHNKILNEVSELKTRSRTAEESITRLENDIKKLKNGTPTESSNVSSISKENILQEIRERAERERNVIIVGIAEIHAEKVEDRITHDTNQVMKLLSKVMNNVSHPIKIIRLGKYKPGKNRSIKVKFNSSSESREILKNKANIRDQNIKVFADQTPSQQSYMKELREELSNRQKHEDNLTIKYIKGIPKIVKTTKN